VSAPAPAPLPPPEFLEDAIIVAGLALMTSKNPKDTAAAYARLIALKAERDRLKRAAA
jgi:hypothetical protein